MKNRVIHIPNRLEQSERSWSETPREYIDERAAIEVAKGAVDDLDVPAVLPDHAEPEADASDGADNA